jgi:hypothetical protein
MRVRQKRPREDSTQTQQVNRKHISARLKQALQPALDSIDDHIKHRSSSTTSQLQVSRKQGQEGSYH